MNLNISRLIPIEKIFIKKNIRTDTDAELGEQMESMLQYGQLQNAGVYPRHGDPRGEYELVWGHRRFRAAQNNNEQYLECKVLDPNVVPESAIPILKLQENVVRKPLTTEEFLAAVDAIKAANPSMTDAQVSRKIGKYPGYIGLKRSIQHAREEMALDGRFTQKTLDVMSDDEIIEVRARLNNPVKPTRGNAGAFHREGVPKAGFEIQSPRGPNIVVICAGTNTKARVIRVLKKLARETA